MRRSGGAYKAPQKTLYLLCFERIRLEAEFCGNFSEAFLFEFNLFLYGIYSFGMDPIVFSSWPNLAAHTTSLDF